MTNFRLTYDGTFECYKYQVLKSQGSIKVTLAASLQQRKRRLRLEIGFNLGKAWRHVLRRDCLHLWFS